MVVSVEGLPAPERMVEFYRVLGLALIEAAHDEDGVVVIAHLAVAVVPGAQQASLSEGRDGRFRTLASTGAMASDGDRIQYDLGSGPCVEAMVDDTVFRSGDVAADPRWTAFGARAQAEAGVRSMLSLRLLLEQDGRIAGLTFYSTHTDAFDDNDEIIATAAVTHCALALRATMARERVADLERALETNRQIGMAMGILMATHHVTGPDAFALLRTASQNGNRKLAVVADAVIRAGAIEALASAADTDRRSVARKPTPGAATAGSGYRQR